MKELDLLKSEYSKCELCKELAKNRNNVVFGVGNPETCKVVIIGEAPGKNEDEKNEPFVGKSGQLLTSLLDEIGLNRPHDVYITNTVLCRPPNNRNPTKSELLNCKVRLDSQIELLNPSLVITLGNFATKYFLDTKKGITHIHGQVFKKNLNGKYVKVVPMLHPAVLLYNGNSPKKRAEFQSDFKIVAKLLKE